MNVSSPVELPAAHFHALAVTEKLAQNAEASKHGFPTITDGWIAEPKLDGWRLMALVGHDSVSFFTRSGATYNVLPKIEAELLAACPPGTVLDGEAVALHIKDGIVVKNFGKTQSILSKHAPGAAADKITFMVFDLIAHRGIDARSLPFAKRRALLERIFDGYPFEKVQLIAQMHATEDHYTAALASGFEGVVLKRLNAPYASAKRGYGWVKVKPTISVEGVVMGFQKGKSGFAGMVGAVIFGQHDDNGKLVERGRVSGMDMRTRLSMTHNPEKWLGKVIEVVHEGVSVGESESGRFRFPRFKRTRPDRSPESVVLHDV